MVITYHGENYFKISSGNSTVLVNPSNQRSYKGASLILFTEKNLENDNKNAEETFLIDYPGEFEINDIRIQGWHTEAKNRTIQTIYRIVFDEISIAILGDLQKEPNQEFTERLEATDIVITPAGGKNLSSDTIAKFLRQIEPGIIIPAEEGKNLKDFFKAFGVEALTCEEKLVIKKKDITSNEMKITCLKSE